MSAVRQLRGETMHQLLRRAALVLTLPLAAGVPVVLGAAPAHAFADSVSVSISSEEVVYGQVVTATAAVSDGTNPTTDGCVQFQVSLTGHEPIMDVSVPLNSSGTAT